MNPLSTLFHPQITASFSNSPPDNHSLIATLNTAPSLLTSKNTKNLFVFAPTNFILNTPPTQKYALEPEAVIKYARTSLRKLDNALIVTAFHDPSFRTTAITAYSIQKGTLRSVSPFSVPHSPDNPLFNADATLLFERIRLQHPEVPIVWLGPLEPPVTIKNTLTTPPFSWNQKPTYSFNTSHSAKLRAVLALPLLMLTITFAVYCLALGIPYYSYSSAASTLNMQSKELQGVYQFNSERLSTLQALENFSQARTLREATAQKQLASLINLLSVINATPSAQLKATNISATPKLLSMAMLMPSASPSKTPLQSQLRSSTTFLLKLEITTPPSEAPTPDGYYTETLRPLIQYWSQSSGLPLYATPSNRANSSKANAASLQITLVGEFPPAPSEASTHLAPSNPLTILKNNTNRR